MTTRRARLALFVLAALVVPVARPLAQATPNVPLSETVYRDLDVLAASGLIDSMIYGFRPWSRHEVMRLLNEAKRNLPRLTTGAAWSQETIDFYLRRYEGAPATGVDVAWADLTALNSQARTVPADSNGRIDALIEPLLANRDGTRWRDGANVAAEARAVATLGPHVVLTASPRFVTSLERDRSGATAVLSLQEVGVTTLFGNLSIGVGREHIVFGQAPTGGLLLSQNAPALDVVRLSSDRPWQAPWIFRFLGPLRASAFIADLGPNQNVPHVKLIGYRFSALLHPQFEIGAEVMDEMGGRGGPGAVFRDRVYDALPLIDIFKTSTDFQFSNKLAGVDMHWRVPRWRGFELYAETAVDDIDARRWKSSFLEDGGYIAGVSLSCLSQCGTVGVRAEYHQTGIRYYTHGQFTSGIAKDHFVLGDPLGPRGLGAYVSADRSDSRGMLTVSAALEVRSGNRYASATTGTHERGFHFVLIERHPSERRTRFATSWRPRADRGRLGWRFDGAAEVVENFGFEQGKTRFNFMTQIAVEFRP